MSLDPATKNHAPRRFAEAGAPELVEAFFQALLASGARSVLDVGCGEGDLVRELARAGVEARGIELAPSAAARASGRVLCASAERLPLRDRCVDWVSFRHVPHHLPRPRMAFAEAWRVSRVGLLLAEPWFEPSLESQRLAARLDRWTKEKERRRGRFHGDVLSAAELIALLPEPADCALEFLAPLRRHEAEALAAELRDSIGELTLDIEEQAQRRAFLEAARAGALTRNGSLILRVKRRLGSTPSSASAPLSPSS